MLWETFVAAKMWGTRPSDILGIEGSYEAFCIDQAVGEFGSFIEGELDKVKGKNADQTAGRRTALLRSLLTADTAESGRFATPVATVTREEFESRG